MLLECKGVEASYGPSRVLHGLSLSVPAGEVSAIVGRNGMGKTTLAHTIMGFMSASSGSISFNGQELRGKPPERIANAGISLVPQGRRIFPSLSVIENIQVAAKAPDGRSAWDVDSVCKLFPVLNDRRQQRAASLSGGEQQMLAVARAMVRNPLLIIMDEPSEGLDPERVGAIRGVIEALRDHGTAVLLIEQKTRLVMDVADTVGVMSRGEITHHSPISLHEENPGLLAKHLGLG